MVERKRVSEPTAANQEEPPRLYSSWVAAGTMKMPFIEHLKATNEPETFPGLAHYKPPRKDVPFVLIVEEFVIDPFKRPDGEMIRCAACGTKKKFKKGSLAYFPEEQVLRVVGNECGAERRAEAAADFKNRQNHKIVSEHLLDELLKVKAYQARVLALRPAADHAQSLSADVRKQAKSFCRIVIKEMKEGNGILGFMQYPTKADGRVMEGHRLGIHRVAGGDFLRPAYTPGNRLALVWHRLIECDRGDEEQALQWLVENDENQSELAKLSLVLRNALKDLTMVENMIGFAREFLQPENLLGIDRWADQAAIGFLRVEIKPNRVILFGPRENHRSFAAAISPNLSLLTI